VGRILTRRKEVGVRLPRAVKAVTILEMGVSGCRLIERGGDNSEDLLLVCMV